MLKAEFATSSGRTANTRKGNRGASKRRAHRVRKAQTQERKGDRHDLGRAAARAQIEEGVPKKKEEYGEKHLRRARRWQRAALPDGRQAEWPPASGRNERQAGAAK